MIGVQIHQRVFKRHPELNEKSIKHAWKYYDYAAVRIPGEQEVRTGHDLLGRNIEMVGVLTKNGWLIYHAMTPPSKKTKDEIKKAKRRQL